MNSKKYRMEVRRADSGELLARLTPQETTEAALGSATRLLAACGGCLLGARNEKLPSGVPLVVVEASAFPFVVWICNTQLVGFDGEPLVRGDGIGPFPVRGNAAVT